MLVTISTNDFLLRKFNETFPSFNGGMRELRFMVGTLGIDSDTYQNPLFEVKRQIATHLQLNKSVGEQIVIYRYLRESKVDIDAFDFIGESRSQLSLIEEQILMLLQHFNVRGYLVSKFQPKEKFIFFIDGISTTDKEMYVSGVAKEVSRIVREMNYLDWFNDDPDKVVAADNNFRKRYPNASASPYFERFGDVEDIRIFYYKNRANTAQLRLDFKSTQSYFNNRRARENPDKKQRNFSLSIAANRNINKLANDRGITRSAVVDMVFKDLKNWHKLQD